MAKTNPDGFGDPTERSPLAERPPILWRAVRQIDAAIQDALTELLEVPCIQESATLRERLRQFALTEFQAENESPDAWYECATECTEFYFDTQPLRSLWEVPRIATDAIRYLAISARRCRNGHQFNAAIAYADARYEIGRIRGSSDFAAVHADDLDREKVRDRVLSSAQRKRAKKGWENNELYQSQKQQAKSIYDDWQNGILQFRSLQSWGMYVLAHVPGINDLKTVLDWERYKWRAKPLPKPKKKKPKKRNV
ncbi:MAG: hypothetical protein AB7E72_21630 [Lysobacterales bacterium]